LIKALVIRGDFTPDEFSRFISLSRRIDEAASGNPIRRRFIIEAFDEDSSLEEIERVMRDALKPEPGRETLITTLRKTDA
jgi:hypothetical protein